MSGQTIHIVSAYHHFWVNVEDRIFIDFGEKIAKPLEQHRRRWKAVDDASEQKRYRDSFKAFDGKPEQVFHVAVMCAV